MKALAAIVLVCLQAVFALVVLWQVLGLLPVLGWIGQDIGTGYLFIAGIKAAIGLIAAGLFWGAGRLRKRVTAK